MTTEVIVKAHCAANKEVHIRIENDPGSPPHFFSKILQDGETWQGVVYESKSIKVYEQSKT